MVGTVRHDSFPTKRLGGSDSNPGPEFAGSDGGVHASEVTFLVT